MTWLYALAVLAVLVAGGMMWAMRAGKKSERLKDAKADLDAAAEAKRIAESVDAMPDGAALSELRKRRGLLPTGSDHRN